MRKCGKLFQVFISFFLSQEARIYVVVMSPQAPLGCHSSQMLLVLDDPDSFEEHWPGMFQTAP